MSDPLTNFFRSKSDIGIVGRTVDDARLVDQSLGEPGEFAGLYERHSVAVNRYVARRVGMLEDTAST
jgi:hypothetical protein